MRLKQLLLFASILVAFLVSAGKAEDERTAAELILQGHKHDNMYTFGPEASQEKAISYYESALAAEPDEKQRLHILYRMGQLYGSAYQREKGEKPNFVKAVELYKEIVDSYGPEEPLVYKAMSSICDHYTTLRKFDEAIRWSKKVLEYDTAAAAEQAGGAGQKKRLSQIKRYQKIAVDQVAYSAARIDPLVAHGELRAIADKYAGTFIGDRAGERLAENMDKMSELWALPLDTQPAEGGSSIQAGSGGPSGVVLSQKGIELQRDSTSETTARLSSVGPNTTFKPQEAKHTAAEPRAPPASYLLEYFVAAAAGLAVLGLAAIVIRKKKTFA